MKKLTLATLALSMLVSSAYAQEKITNLKQRVNEPSYSDMYCAGFITTEPISSSSLIMGGAQSPHTTVFANGELVFLSGGTYTEGSQYTVLRELRDPNRRELFKGQHKAISSAGQPWGEVGRVKVQTIRGNVAVAMVEQSCQSVTVGDIVVPFKEKPAVSFRPNKATFSEFPVEGNKLWGRIIMAREFDSAIGMGVGQKAYLNVGQSQGVKPGDYFRIFQSYDPMRMEDVDSLSYKAPSGEDTQKHPIMLTRQAAQKLPRHAVGEMIILSTSPNSATGMITLSLESVQVGDSVELEEGR